jgi:flagellin
MSMVVNTNVLSLVAQTNLNNTQNKLNNAITQLSSGLRINSAMDDPAGLAIATGMQSQVNGMNQGVINANAAVSLSQVADGAMGSVSNMLQQMRTLAVEAANGTNGSGAGSADANLDAEYQQLATQIANTLGSTQFNGVAVFSQSATITYQVGANTTDQVAVALGSAGSTLATDVALKAASLGSVINPASASAAIAAIDTALGDVNTARAQNGAYEIQFQQIVASTQINSQNTAAAESQIMDTNYAQATSALTQAQIVQQAGTAMLSQANSQPQSVLTLLSKLQ